MAGSHLGRPAHALLCLSVHHPDHSHCWGVEGHSRTEKVIYTIYASCMELWGALSASAKAPPEAFCLTLLERGADLYAVPLSLALHASCSSYRVPLAGWS